MTYWLGWFDGITLAMTFYYLVAGDSFCGRETMVFLGLSFLAPRWAGLYPCWINRFYFGNDPQYVSSHILNQLFRHISSYFLRITKRNKCLDCAQSLVCTQVYFLHFLTKVIQILSWYFGFALFLCSDLIEISMEFWQDYFSLSAYSQAFWPKKPDYIFLAPFPILLGLLRLQGQTSLIEI